MSTLLPLLALSVWVGAQDHPAKDHTAQEHKGKPPAVEVAAMKAHRNDDLIEVAAEVKNSSDKPLKKLVIIFEFQDGAGNPISTEEMKVDEQPLMPDAESSLSVQLKDPPRATQVRIGAQAGGGVELTVGDSGPYPIE